MEQKERVFILAHLTKSGKIAKGYKKYTLKEFQEQLRVEAPQEKEYDAMQFKFTLKSYFTLLKNLQKELRGMALHFTKIGHEKTKAEVNAKLIIMASDLKMQVKEMK
jgi:hypothetical protein